jgi:Asp-tRNA(Asn)/Glu-tRNA(Gln) amidotransferase A subunit family amidase
MPEPKTITDAARFIRRGELTPVELLEQCLSRIDRYEDRIRAWVYIDCDGAREQAERLTAELKRGENRGPLHGIPVGVKDIIDVFDMPTGCGSKLWANSYARRDATVVERLRQAGAVIMGKTVTTAFASFDPPVTRNPWNLERTPGGSSSGSAAAVASGMCLGALASQTGGSITRPASYCGVCGLKPTYGRVSVDGVLPLAPSLDHVGVIANCVRDLGLLYRVIARTMDYEKYDGIEITDPLPKGSDWGLAREHRLSKPRLWCQLTNDFFPAHTEPVMASAFREFVERLTGQGEPGETFFSGVVLPSAFALIPRAHHVVMAVEAASYHRERIERHPDDYPPRITGLICDGLATPAHEYREALDLRRELFRQLPSALIVPATTGPAPPAETTGNPLFNSPWSFLGMPVVSLPMGWSPDGLPLAVQLIGEQLTDDALLQWAEEVEAALGFEPRPLPL